MIQIGVVHREGQTSQTPRPKGATPPVPSHIHKGNKYWPYVQFENGLSLLCIPVMFEVMNAQGRIEASREQVPLILAWAISIHKSPGQTLKRVRVNLGRIFEKGQAYVVLSRATSIEMLEVKEFEPSRVRAHRRVLDWMQECPPVSPAKPAAAVNTRVM